MTIRLAAPLQLDSIVDGEGLGQLSGHKVVLTTALMSQSFYP